jgi:ribosomal 30S subunit maturation factor RimM
MAPIHEDGPDFSGYDIKDQSSDRSYPVTNMVYLPNNTLIEFRVDFKDVLLPFHDDIILSIDDDKKLIIAAFPDGILDL